MELDLDLTGKLFASLNQLNSHMGKISASLDQRKSDVQRNVPFRGSGICPTPTASFAFMVADPQVGRIQILRQFNVGAPLWTTTVAGSAILYRAGSSPLQGGTISTESVVAYAATLPAVAQWGGQEVPIISGDNLWCVIINGTAGQQYVASAQLEDYQSGGYSATIQL
jgi:hypothetical protein